MTLIEFHTLLDDFNEIRRLIGKAKMSNDVGWRRMCDEDLDNIGKHLRFIQDRIILEKTMEVLTNPIVEI